MIKNLDLDLEFMNTIPAPPQSAEQMYAQSSSNDGVTVKYWKERWVANTRANFEKFGDFKKSSVGSLFGKHTHKPCIVVGSGPSLRHNVDKLKDTKGVPIVSCLHNFHYLEDHGVPVEYYVSLDAGDVTLEEIAEGGGKTIEEYLEISKDRTLVAYIGSSPKLTQSWRGKILWFNVISSGQEVYEETDKICKFNTFFSTGGNVLGAATYLAKAIMGCNPIAFVGADFSFSYTKKFHAWDSKYDKDVGQAIRCVDVWGNKVLTWQSYYNFKTWFDWLACNVPGIYINCTEGGLMGAYPEGNIKQVQQMLLKDFIWMYSIHEEIREQCENPETPVLKTLY
jgi:hypothetical protein